MTKRFQNVATAVFAVVLCIGTAVADTVPMGQTETFEGYGIGDVPPTIMPAFGSHGTAIVQGDASNQYAVLTPGAVDTRGAGFREGPYGAIGRQTAFPGLGDTYSVFTDIYAASAPDATGTLSWINMLTNKNTGGYLDENSFVLTPGASTWKASFTSGSDPSNVNLEVGAWYTFEMIFDRSVGTNYAVTGNIYKQGSSVFSSTMTQNTLSADLGGPMTSWFTKWGNNTVDSLMIDNIGSAAVTPTPVAATAGLVLMGLTAMKRRRT